MIFYLILFSSFKDKTEQLTVQIWTPSVQKWKKILRYEL